MLKIKINKHDHNRLRNTIAEQRAISLSREFKNRNQNIILESWRNALSGDYSLIHAIKPDRGLSGRSVNVRSPFLFRPVNSILSEWDIISTSVINYSKCRHDISGASGRGCLHIHLELDIPVQNIVGTHVSDVGFNNHAGRVNDAPTGQLVDKRALFKALTSTVSDEDIPYNNLIHFYDFKPHISNRHWSEVLVTGRSDIRIYHNHPATKPIKLKAIHYYPYEALNAVLDDNLKEIFIGHTHFLKKLMQLNDIRCFYFSLEHERKKYEGIKFLYDMLVSEFGPPAGKNIFYLHGRRHSVV